MKTKMTFKTTFKTAQTELRKLDISLRRITGTGEYRVNFFGAPEGCAYYSDDLLDAYQTGKIMAANYATLSR
jgi:hypothetical protein